MTTLDYGVLIGYFAIMAGIGLLCMRRIHAQDDYFLGGRGFGKLLQTFAAFGAGTGSADPVNTARTTFTSGMSGMWSVMYWLFVTPFYWITAIWYRRMRHTTLGDWFTERYESRALGAAYALFGLFFMVTYGSMMFSAIGKVAAPLVGPTIADGSAVGIEYTLVPVIGVIVLIYGTAGGLRAAYWTDLVQGLCIIVLSLLLIPYGLNALVEKFGDPETMGMLDGFRLMHEQIPPEFFSVVGQTETSQFPLHFVAAIVVINLFTVVIQPHFIVTGGGSAKTENNARVGLVVGNFLKRFCTVGWVLTALIALALFAGHPELSVDPDKTWGVASRELLGSGLTGLMLACLLAALMSSIDVYMIIGSSLVVRNIYVPFLSPNAGERECLLAARLTGAAVVGGSVVLSLVMMDVFAQLMLTWIVLVPVAAPFWIGMYWRRATTAAAWTTIVFCVTLFFALPWLIPTLNPDLRSNSEFTKLTPIVEVTTTRAAAPTDVARRQAAIDRWDAEADSQPEDDSRGPRPEALAPGDPLEETRVVGGEPVYWSGEVVPIDERGDRLSDIEPEPAGEPFITDTGAIRQPLAYDSAQPMLGVGNFRADLLLYDLIGLPLDQYSSATLATLQLPLKIVLPLLVMIAVSLVTPANSKAALDRYYVKMKTPATGDPEVDAAELEASYRQPDRFEHRKIWPGTNLEFQKPTRADAIGFVVCVATCFAIIFFAAWLVNIGS